MSGLAILTLLGLVAVTFGGIGFVVGHLTGSSSTDRMWVQQLESEQQPKLSPDTWVAARELDGFPEPLSPRLHETQQLPAVRTTTPAPTVVEVEETWLDRLLWSVVMHAMDFWHTPIGERIDRAAVWLGQYEPRFTADLPGPQHAVPALPAWATPTGEWLPVPPLDDEQVLRDLEVDVAIDELVYAQEVAHAA